MEVRRNIRHGNLRQILKPIIRAYALGYLSAITPRLVTYVRQLGIRNWSLDQKLQELAQVLARPLNINAFPTFCGALVGGSTLLPVLCHRIFAYITSNVSRGNIRLPQGIHRLVRFLAAFCSAWFSFQLLNKTRAITSRGLGAENAPSSSNHDDPSEAPANIMGRPRSELAGRTMDLTLFTATRAVDVMACIAWNRWSRYRKSRGRWTTAESLTPGLADAGVFAMSAAVVMWAWFYLPERLPRTYEKWIGGVAKVDSRLIEALRRARRGVFVYGKDTGQAPLLESMCRDFDWPIEWGDPAKTVPIPCEMVHMGCGPNCEVHAVSRFAKTFKFACATYIPLQLVLRMRSMKTPAALVRAISEAAQSSAFLASFVALFYYSVCLARTRLGPKVFDQKTVTPLMWDSGLCVGAGCLMCGWSVLVEKARKRQELALFVAPRAAATVLPRLYDKKPLSSIFGVLSEAIAGLSRRANTWGLLQYQHRERVAFALSAAILLTCLREKPSLVRGVFGRIASGVLN